MAIIFTIANEKGGVGKTTTAVNLSAGLALRLSDHPAPDSRVLLVDMDPQGHALLATAYGLKPANENETLAALLTEIPPPSIQRMIRPGVHHANLNVLLSSHGALVHAARSLPSLMANETRLARALAPVLNEFAYIIIDTPPNSGDLLINSLVAAEHVIIPVETSYLGVSGLRELQRTIDEVRLHFHPDLQIFGYLPTLCEENRSESQEILAELNQRFPGQVLPPIHKSTDLAYAHSSHMDVFAYRPPRQQGSENIASSSRATQEYASLVDAVLQRTWNAYEDKRNSHANTNP
jgi:chromosome partitioning protein